MHYKFTNKKISGILSVVPENCVKFEDEINNYGFSQEKMINLQKVIGFNERRIVKGNECTSDLCIFGLEYLIKNNFIDKNEIGAIIYITQTPDHFMPPTSFIIHGKLGFKDDVLCFDINQGCAGYLYGLLQAFLLLEQLNNRKVALLVGDTLSRRAYYKDRNVYPLVGDAASVTIVENTDEDNEILLNMITDGSRNDWLIIPAGAFRIPSSEHTRKIKHYPDGNQRSKEHLYMNGPGIFMFTQTDVPRAIKEMSQFASLPLEKVDYFMFHQANRFILEKLAHKLGVPVKKMPNNIVEKYGNSSSATIPLAICDNIGDAIVDDSFLIFMSGFGVGLSLGMLIMKVGPLDFCDILEM